MSGELTTYSWASILMFTRSSTSKSFSGSYSVRTYYFFLAIKGGLFEEVYPYVYLFTLVKGLLGCDNLFVISRYLLKNLAPFLLIINSGLSSYLLKLCYLAVSLPAIGWRPLNPWPYCLVFLLWIAFRSSQVLLDMSIPRISLSLLFAS